MFTIRPGTKQDIAAVDAMMAQSYPRLLAADYPPSVLVRALPLIARAQPALITSGTYYVAEEGARILGAGGWTRAAPGSGEEVPGQAHIRHVSTDHRALRRGVARAVLTHVLSEAREAGVHRMHCLSTRTAAPFYEAMGFAGRDEVSVQMAPGIAFPAVEMTRAL